MSIVNYSTIYLNITGRRWSVRKCSLFSEWYT